ncbi:hypothetical protein NEOLEDRAFT_1136860 [Neolentinus lepideus HHB14362 ss-1]|uniref:Uncharacterized protein n=1 Tax=Neolentinus lepideus HHB14362 ss-1 TaxID=1314782 RepID=A0A165R2T8_9AGAM|nr:hypothetical protein NEOLEDRAFT_1136860 [Neolentinus lepideus HHB14362 ss-1]
MDCSTRPAPALHVVLRVKLDSSLTFNAAALPFRRFFGPFSSKSASLRTSIKEIMSSPCSNLIEASLNRLVQRTLDGPGPSFATDPGGSGWFTSFLCSFPPSPSPTRTQLYPFTDYHRPPTGILGAGPCDGVIASLVLVIGDFVFFTAMGPFNCTRQGGFRSLA